MSKPHRVLSLLGGAAAALAVSLIVPMAPGHAEGNADHTFPPGDGGPYETCDGDVCLVMGDAAQADWQYSGVRPFFTDWKTDNQLYTVEVDQGAGTDPVTAGTYDMYVQDMWTPYIAVSHYEYGDFTPNPDAPSDLDLGGFADLSGTVIYDTRYWGGLVDQLTINDVMVHGHELDYIVLSMGDFTGVLAHTTTDSAAYYQFGDSEPVFVWNSFFHSWAPEVPDYVIPADPFAQIDFDPSDYVFGGVATMDVPEIAADVW